jgi:hypothetical protein
MTCVTHAGGHRDLWWFSTSKRGWKAVVVDQTVANGAVSNLPKGSKHVMTSVGLDLWLHGGKMNCHHYIGGEGE